MVGYPLNSLRKEINASLSKPTEAYLVSSRIEQGREETMVSTMVERQEVIEKWTSMKMPQQPGSKPMPKKVLQVCT